MQNEICIEMSGISKYFGPVAANENASLAVRRGEIHALLGENGSGKSTLMNMLAGIYSPDAGTIKINGEAKTFASPHDSLAAGIGMVHQHFKLVEVLSAAENISAGSSTRTPISTRLERLGMFSDSQTLSIHLLPLRPAEITHFLVK